MKSESILDTFQVLSRHMCWLVATKKIRTCDCGSEWWSESGKQGHPENEVRAQRPGHRKACIHCRPTQVTETTKNYNQDNMMYVNSLPKTLCAFEMLG